MEWRYQRWFYVGYTVAIWLYTIPSFAKHVELPVPETNVTTSWITEDQSSGIVKDMLSNVTKISSTQNNKESEMNKNMSTSSSAKQDVSKFVMKEIKEREMTLNITLENRTTSHVVNLLKETEPQDEPVNKTLLTISHSENGSVQRENSSNTMNIKKTITKLLAKSTSGKGRVEGQILSSGTFSDWASQNETNNTDWACPNKNKIKDSQQNIQHSNESGSMSLLSAFEYLHCVLIPVFLVVGLIGNTFNVIIMLSEKFRGMTTSLIIIWLAISDTTFILTVPFVEDYFSRWIGVDFKSLSDIGCKVFFGMLRFSKMMSSWLVVLIAFERFMAVWFPLHVRMICSRRNIKIAISCIFTVISFYIGGWATLSKLDSTGVCVPFCCDDTDAPTPKGLIIGFTLLYGFIPSVILLILTAAIIGRLCLQRKRRAKMTSDHTAKAPAPNRIGMLISIPITYIVLVMPAWVGVNIANRTQRMSIYIDELQFLQQVVGILQQVNFSINFFLYIAFSRCYRERLLSIVCRCRKIKRASFG